MQGRFAAAGEDGHERKRAEQFRRVVQAPVAGVRGERQKKHATFHIQRSMSGWELNVEC
jgi:hypothetical protein